MAQTFNKCTFDKYPPCPYYFIGPMSYDQEKQTKMNRNEKKNIKFCGIDFMGHQNSVKGRSCLARERVSLMEKTDINYRDKNTGLIAWATVRNNKKQVKTSLNLNK